MYCFGFSLLGKDCWLEWGGVTRGRRFIDVERTGSDYHFWIGPLYVLFERWSYRPRVRRA